MLTNSLLWFCLGDTQHFFAHSIIVSVLFNDTLCLSLLVSRVLKVGSRLACLCLSCLWVFCHIFPSFGLGLTFGTEQSYPEEEFKGQGWVYLNLERLTVLMSLFFC